MNSKSSKRGRRRKKSLPPWPAVFPANLEAPTVVIATPSYPLMAPGYGPHARRERIAKNKIKKNKRPDGTRREASRGGCRREGTAQASIPTVRFRFRFRFGSVRFGSVRFGSVRFGSFFVHPTAKIHAALH